MGKKEMKVSIAATKTAKIIFGSTILSKALIQLAANG